MKINKSLFLIVLFVFLLSSAILLWKYFERLDKHIIQSEAEIIEKQAITKIEENFKIRKDVVKLFTQQVQLMGAFDSAKFINNAKIYYENYPGFQAINWINKKGIIQWVYPIKGNLKAYGKDLHFHPDEKCRNSFLTAERTEKLKITPIIKLLQGGYGVVIYSPVIKNGKITGYINGVFNVNKFFKTVLDDYSAMYKFKIYNKNTIFYGDLNDSTGHYFFPIKFKLGNNEFFFALENQPKTGYRNYRNLLILFLGILFSISITLFFWLLLRNVEAQKNTTEKIYNMYRELHNKQYEINTIIDNNPDGIVRIDTNGDISQVNIEFLKIHGYKFDDNYPKNIYKYTEKGSKEKLESAIRGIIKLKHSKKFFEITTLTKDKKCVFLELNIIPVIEDSGCNYIWIFARDLTEFNKLKEKAEQQTKMEAIGKVASVIAHDFNNILTGIIGYADMIINDKKQSEKTKNYAANIKKSGLMAKEFTKDLLQFSRKELLNKTVFDLNKMIEDQSGILKNSLKNGVSLKFSLDKKPCIVNADRVKMERVLMNLVINANDAIEGEGHITIGTSHKVTDNGNFVVLKVKDNGSGIPKNIINKIFEPFFSTKEAGKGTGLGLSIVYGSVKQHKGDISVSSEEGKGTVFEIVLPEEGAQKITEEFKPVSEHSIEGKEKILLVDDDMESLNVIGKMLEGLDYSVKKVSSPEDALVIYKKHFEEYNIVIADYIMPNMNGLELLNTMEKINPAIKAVVISGFIDDTSFLDNKRFPILMKPFTIGELSQILLHY